MTKDPNPFDVLFQLKFDESQHNEVRQTSEIIEKSSSYNYKSEIRIWLEKKHRAGKPVSLVTGIEASETDIKELAKMLKKKMGVGGTTEGNNILIQSQNRDDIIKFLTSKGFKNIKKAGG